MASSEDASRVVAIFARVLGVDAVVAESTCRSASEEWDSLKHIEIVFQVEEEFDVRFGESDIAELRNVESIVSIVERIRGR